MPSRLQALVLVVGLLAAGSAHAQRYCGRTVAFSVQNSVQIKEGEAWVEAVSLPEAPASFRVSPDCQALTDATGRTVPFGQETRSSGGLVFRSQREPNGIVFYATNQRGTEIGFALVIRVNLSPSLLARNACTLDVKLAGAAGGGTVIIQNRTLPISQARIVPRLSRCTATPG